MSGVIVFFGLVIFYFGSLFFFSVFNVIFFIRLYFFLLFWLKFIGFFNVIGGLVMIFIFLSELFDGVWSMRGCIRYIFFILLVVLINVFGLLV